MRSSLYLITLLPLLALARHQHKTKKYKCVEVDDDKDDATHYGWNRADEELKSIGSMHSEPLIPALTPKPYEPPTPAPPPNIPKDHKGRPLILSPEHCAQVKKYSDMYHVTDVLSWVKENCRFAQMFVPEATCEEVNILVASCYKNKFLTN